MQDLIRSNQAPRFGALLFDKLVGFEYGQRYALRWLFYEFLASRRPEECARLFGAAYHAAAYHAAADSAPGAQSTALPNGAGRALERVRPLLERLWTPTELVALDEEFLTFVDAFHPQWGETTGVCEFGPGNLVVLAPPNADALVVNQDAFQSLPFHVEGELRFLPGKSQQLHVVLGHRQDAFLLVSFTAGWGVTLWRHEVQGARWLSKGAVEDTALTAERAYRFRVEARSGELSISLDDEEVLRVPLDGTEALGKFGLGAQAGSNGEWSALEWAEGG